MSQYVGIVFLRLASAEVQRTDPGSFQCESHRSNIYGRVRLDAAELFA